MQLALELPPPRARKRDPATSHVAAAKAARFSESHAGRIHIALMGGPATAHELAERTGLTVVQIDRRRIEMIRAGFVRLLVVDGRVVSRNGFEVWEAVR
jgi:hypothetical protein